MNLIYEEPLVLRSCHCDMEGRWRPDAMLLSMQELAEDHAAQFGNSRAQLLQKGVVWVLARLRLEMKRYPVMGDTVRLATWPGQTVRALFPRYYAFCDGTGEELGTAVTLWMLVDVAEHRMAMPSRFGVTMPDASSLRVPQPNPGRLGVAAEGASLSARRACAYCDLDVNRHMNNTRYAQWVCDLFPPERFHGRSLSSLQINYISEAKPGEHMELFLHDGDSFSVLGRDESTGFTVFEAAGTFLDAPGRAV